MRIPIVVVDDDEADRYLVGRAIKSLELDAKLVEYDDGVHFIATAQDKSKMAEEIGEPPPPLLVLLDLNMPIMDGFEVLEALEQSLNGDDNVFLVTMYSSSNHAEDRADVEKYSFVKDYLVKPITAEKLQLLVDRLYEND